MPRLLFFAPESWPTFRVDVAVLFGRMLPRHGVFSDLVATPAAAAHAATAWGGGALKPVPLRPAWGGRHLRYLLHALRQLWLADRDRFDAILVRDMPVMAAVALIGAGLKGIPVIYWMSYPISRGLMDLAVARRQEGSRLRWLPTWIRGRVGQFLLSRFVLRRARVVFVQSARMRAELAETGVSADRLVPVPMGVDCEAMRALDLAPAVVPVLEGRRVLVYLGTLDRPRQIETLFEMLCLVRARIPEATLLLVGDTRDSAHRRWLMSRARHLGVADAIHLTGWLPMEQAWRQVVRAELALSPFPRGPLLDSASPTKVPEYLALGIPVVCNDNPDQRELIEATGAGSCVPYTAEHFAKAALHWLEMDPDERHQRALRGMRQVAELRDYEVISRDVADQIRQRLNAVRPGRH